MQEAVSKRLSHDEVGPAETAIARRSGEHIHSSRGIRPVGCRPLSGDEPLDWLPRDRSDQVEILIDVEDGELRELSQ